MKILERLPGENARAYAYRVILDNIINLELAPGDAVSENELSQILQISRTPVREALIEMGRLELVEILPQRGSFVTKIDYSLIEESKFLRLSLENSVLRLACNEGISEHAMHLLNENMSKQKAFEETDYEFNYIMELDNDFHRLLFEAVGKERIYRIVRSQMVHFDRLRTLSFQTLKTEKSARTIKDHENILYALQKRDAELAEMVMTRHLTRHQFEREELYDYHPDYFV